MRVFGIDCGTEITGYGVVESDDLGRQPRLVLKAMGAIRLAKTKTRPERLEQVFRELRPKWSAGSRMPWRLKRFSTR
jgi:crossover junction endodeoxyribonuclease RuvC